MLGLLVKKQLAESFRTYFYDTKHNKPRRKGRVILKFVLFALLMLVVLGGIFTFLSLLLCSGLNEAGYNWLYFVIMGVLALLLGTFGSVFNTYTGLYLSKDNDLLLSMPIPVKHIIASRLLNVYIMGLMYSGIVMLPAVIVYFAIAGFTLLRLVCALLNYLALSALILALSCVFGLLMAKISRYLKRKSFVTVALSIIVFAVYYVLCLKAGEILQDFISNAALYGDKIMGSARFLYNLGLGAAGDLVWAIVFTAICLALLAIVWLLLKKTFFKLATYGGKSEKGGFAKPQGQKSVFSALLNKELGRFISSPGYMLNCGLCIVLAPALGIVLLIKGSALLEEFGGYLSSEILCAMLTAVLFALASINDIAAPSISLEGKAIWLPKSLPVSAKSVLRAKAALHFILTALPVLISGVLGCIALRLNALQWLLTLAAALCYCAFSALFSCLLGLKLANLNWTSEITPIKQGGAAAASIFGSMGITALIAGLYIWVGYKIGTAYIGAVALMFTVAAYLLLRYLDTRGAERFKEL